MVEEVEGVNVADASFVALPPCSPLAIAAGGFKAGHADRCGSADGLERRRLG